MSRLSGTYTKGHIYYFGHVQRELLFTNSNLKTPVFVSQATLESYLDMALPCHVPSLS